MPQITVGNIVDGVLNGLTVEGDGMIQISQVGPGHMSGNSVVNNSTLISGFGLQPFRFEVHQGNWHFAGGVPGNIHATAGSPTADSLGPTHQDSDVYIDPDVLASGGVKNAFLYGDAWVGPGSWLPGATMRDGSIRHSKAPNCTLVKADLCCDTSASDSTIKDSRCCKIESVGDTIKDSTLRDGTFKPGSTVKNSHCSHYEGRQPGETLKNCTDADPRAAWETGHTRDYVSRA